MHIEEIGDDPTYVVARCDNVLVNIWRDTLTLESLERSQELGRRLDKEYPDGIGVMTVVPYGIPLPDARVRDAAAELMKEADRWVRARAMVLEGDGFWASTARSMYTALKIFTKTPCPQKTFGDSFEACRWISECLGAPGQADALASAIGTLEKRLGERATFPSVPPR
jgi:hypothetical protein